MATHAQASQTDTAGRQDADHMSDEDIAHMVRPTLSTIEEQIRQIVHDQLEQSGRGAQGDSSSPTNQAGQQSDPAGRTDSGRPENAQPLGGNAPQAANRSNEPAEATTKARKDRMTTEVETRPAQQSREEQEQPQAQDERQGQPEAQAGQQGEPQAEQRQNGEADRQQDEEDDAQRDPFVALLRQQIMDAMEPVLDDLRENIEQAVEQQKENVLELDEQDLQKKVDQSLEPMRHEVQSQVDQTVQDLKQERDKPPQTNLQQAIQRTVKALKETMQWLARTLRALLKTVVALLKAVVNLVIMILLAIFEGLKSLGGAAAGGVKAIGGGIMDMIKKMALKGGQGLVDKFLPEPDSDKQGDEQGKDQPEGHQSEQKQAA